MRSESSIGLGGIGSSTYNMVQIDLDHVKLLKHCCRAFSQSQYITPSIEEIVVPAMFLLTSRKRLIQSIRIHDNLLQTMISNYGLSPHVIRLIRSYLFTYLNDRVFSRLTRSL